MTYLTAQGGRTKQLFSWAIVQSVCEYHYVMLVYSNHEYQIKLQHYTKTGSQVIQSIATPKMNDTLEKAATIYLSRFILTQSFLHALEKKQLLRGIAVIMNFQMPSQYPHRL